MYNEKIHTKNEVSINHIVTLEKEIRDISIDCIRESIRESNGVIEISKEFPVYIKNTIDSLSYRVTALKEDSETNVISFDCVDVDGNTSSFYVINEFNQVEDYIEVDLVDIIYAMQLEYEKQQQVLVFPVFREV